MTHFNIGIDTGGTYTDAVIVNPQNHETIATAKSLTTRGKLEIGITNALGAVMRESSHLMQAQQIGLVSLSTTLATNALVEGMGSSVAVVLIGFSDDMVKRSHLSVAIPSAKIIRIDGGHEYDGRETCALDETKLIQEIESIKNSVDAFAVAGNYSIRNPEHEQLTKQVISKCCEHPTTISSELSDGLNGPLRALTATFNVRIVSLIIKLVDSVRLSMAEYEIDAPLMIVKGDGSIASADSVIERPIETILSGPAASVIGANFIANLNDFVIADVGGTTSDVATVRNGWPKINESGAMAGGYRTMVRAIDMQTIGLGGDSEVEVNHKGIIGLRNNRVVPVSLLCDRFPELLDQLKTSLADGMGLARAIRYIFLPEGFERQLLPAGLSDVDKEFLLKINHQPQLFDRIVVRASDRARAERFIDHGIVQVSGLTPSDAAHALGLQSQWSTEGARLACLMLGRSHALISWKSEEFDNDIEGFARQVFDAMAGKSSRLIVNQLSGENFSGDNALVNTVTHGEGTLGDLSVSLTPTIPVVAVGGPAAVFYPEVGRRLNSEIVIPTNAEVANAIGAAIGRIKIRKVIEITGVESGGYHIHHQSKPVFSINAGDALERARQLADSYVRNKASSMGGSSPEINIHVERVDLPNMDEERSLIAATVIAECLSTPAS